MSSNVINSLLMNQKLLSYLFYGFLVAVIVLALFLLNYQIKHNKDRPNNQPVINVVSEAETDSNVTDERPAKTPVINISTIETAAKVEHSKVPADAALSYLDIYQQLQAAKACSRFYAFWRNNGLAADVSELVRPSQGLYGQVDLLPGEQVPLTAGQTEALVHWVQRCYGLWTDYGVFNAADNNTIPINDITDALTKKLLVTMPKSKAGKAIKQTRQLAAQWQQSFAQLVAVLEGEDSDDTAGLQLLHSEIEQLQQLREELRLQWLEVRHSDESLAQSLSEQRNDLYQQIDQYEAEIKSQKVVNQTQLKEVLADFQSHDQALIQALYTDVAQAFYEALITLEGEQTYWRNQLGFSYHSTQSEPANQFRITPDQLVFEISGRQNRLQHSHVLRYATQMYLCELGWDCGAKSMIVQEYCLFGMYTFPAACGKNLQDFFRQDLISPNRWQDVMQFKNHYQELFNE